VKIALPAVPVLAVAAVAGSWVAVEALVAASVAGVDLPAVAVSEEGSAVAAVTGALVLEQVLASVAVLRAEATLPSSPLPTLSPTLQRLVASLARSSMFET